MKALYRIFLIPGLYVFLFCAALPNLSGQAVQTDTSLLLHLSFDDQLKGAAGEMPKNSKNIAYVQGVSGKALNLGSGSFITFDKLNNLRENRGSLEFWISPKWDISTETAPILTYDGAGGLFFFRNFGSFRAIFNRFGFNNQPELGLISNIADWKAGSWYFVAITWEDGIIKMYFNGQLVDQHRFNFQLPILNDPVFTIGSEYEAGNALLDEFRISNRPKTAVEISEAYFRQLPGLSSLQVRDTSAIPMYPTWKIYLNKPGFWKVPAVFGLSGNDTIAVPNSGMSWIVEDTAVAQIVDGELLAKKPGNTILVGRFGQLSVRIPVRVAQPAKPMERVKVDPFLATPANCHVKEMPVVVIVFLPTLDGVNIDQEENIEWIPVKAQTVDLAGKHVLGINKHLKYTLEEGSKFRGYQNNKVVPYLGYRVIDYFIVHETVPRGFPVPGNKKEFFEDFDQIIKRFNGQYYVDSLGVKEFWIHAGSPKEVAGVESNMASPTTGDISNSYRQPDLPVFSKTYVVYQYNINRSGNEAVHNHGHQLEAMMSHSAWLQDGNASLFWEKFVGAAPGQPPIGRVGDTHHPPNTRNDYDYINTTLVNSDIFDWKPDGGKQTLVNITTWDTLPYNWPSSMYPDREFNLYVPGAESNWYLMWMQSFPGYGSRIPYGNRYMSNWWKMVHDWDTFHKAGLHQAAPEPLAPTCAASFSYAFSLNEICAGGSFQVPYSSSQIYFPPENEFLVELSDTLGGFKTPLVIGSLKSVASSGQIPATLPDNLPFGNKYRIRISNNAGNIEKTASSYFQIAAVPDIIQTVEESCLGRCDGAATVVNQNAYPFQYAWSNGQKGVSATNLCPGDHTLTITGNNGCRTERLFSIASGKASPKQTSLGAAINVNQWIQTGKATVSASPMDIGSTYQIFDDNSTSLARSAGVNPMVITIQFKDVIKTSGFKVNQAWGNGWFTLEAANTLADLEDKSGSYLLLDKERSTSVIRENTDIGIPVFANHNVERKVFRLTVQKSTGDNYVHLWDWAIFGKESYFVDRIKHQPDTLTLFPGQIINLNETNAALTPKIMAYSGKDSFLLDPACVQWSVSNAALLSLDTLQRKVTALQTGSAALLATIGRHQVVLLVKIVVNSLQAKPDSLAFGSDGGTQTITLSSNTTWTVSESLSWLSVNPATGSNDGTVTVTCDANTGTSPRSGTITVSGTGVSAQTISVTQAGVTPALSISPASLSFAAAGENKTFAITSNTTWTVSESLSWLSVNPATGSNDGTVTVTCEANTGTSQRSGTITVSGTGVGAQTISVTQAGATPTLSVSPSTLSFSAGGENKTFSISSNTTWTVSESLSWISVSPATGSSDGTVTVTCDPNAGTSSRSGTITVSGTGVSTRIIIITQAGAAEILTVEPLQVNFGAPAGTQSIQLSSNTNWVAVETADWVSLSAGSGSGNGEIRISVDENPSVQGRSTVLSIRTASSQIVRSVTIAQEGKSVMLPESWMVQATENNHTVILPGNLESEIDGVPLAPGDYIGVFYLHEGKEVCAGNGRWTGSNSSFPVFGDDASTPAKDGMSAGEQFRIKVWQASSQQELPAVAVFAPVGELGIVSATDRYMNDGFSLMRRLTAVKTETQIIPLRAGWNMVSSYVLPEQPSLDSILKQAPGLVEVVKDGAGMIYLSNPLINTIGAWKVTEGYRIRAGSNGDLRMEGKAVDPAQTPIPIRAGWQIIPVFSRTAVSITQALSDLSGKIEVLKDNAGNVYLPDLSINTIGLLQPAQGYRLKAKSAGELRYPAASMSVPDAAGFMDLASLVQDTQRYFRLPADYNTGANATLVFLAEDLNGKLQAGDEIGIFAADTLLCGAGIFKGTNFAVTVWGDDSSRPGRQGIQPGESYQIKVWKHAEGTVYPLTAQYAQGDHLYQEDDVEIIRSIQLAPTSTAERLTPDAFLVFPNPASGLITLLPGQSLDGPVVLRAFHANGQLLHQERQSNAWPAGAGRTLDLSQAPEGMYLIQVLSRNGIWIGKVQVLRR